MSFIELGKRAAKFYARRYKEPLHAMNMSGIEIPIEVFEQGDLSRFHADDLLDDAEAELGITSLQLVPRRFFLNPSRYQDEMTEGILSALDFLGVGGVWSKDEIHLYIHGHSHMDEMIHGYVCMLYKLKNAWIQKALDETKNEVEDLKATVRVLVTM